MHNTLIRFLFFIIVFTHCSIAKAQIGSQTESQIAVLKSYYRTTGCGVFAFAAAYLFSNDKNDSTWVGIIRCPEMAGENFYRKGVKYSIQRSKINIKDSLKGYIVNNPYLKKGYEAFLIIAIKKS